MRRILVENARRKKRLKQGGELARQELVDIPIELPDVHEDLPALDGALDRLKSIDPQAVELIHLRYFAGLSLAKAAKTLRIPSRTADRVWAYARAWLRRERESFSANAGQEDRRHHLPVAHVPVQNAACRNVGKPDLF
jgi:DNA-directed RNA polymerase specialized sigma24 family protein